MDPLQTPITSVMTKKQIRQLIHDKYGGRCAYCGCELNNKFHIDEIEPVRRKQKWLPGRWNEDKWIEGKWISDGCEHPERFHVDNQNPSCASCNINKHSMSLEDFKGLIQGFMKHLNEISTQYKIAKRYGLVSETNEPVRFYFELYEEDRL